MSAIRNFTLTLTSSFLCSIQLLYLTVQESDRESDIEIYLLPENCLHAGVWYWQDEEQFEIGKSILTLYSHHTNEYQLPDGL